jgi:hypothetical protein
MLRAAQNGDRIAPPATTQERTPPDCDASGGSFC